MESKLEHLIEKIKSDGIAEARKSADEIIQKARADAGEILKKAKAEGESIIATAEKEGAKIRSNGEAALRQAARDTVLVTKEQLIHLFDTVFKQEIGVTLKPDFLKEIIVKIAENFNGDMDVLVSAKDLPALKDFVLSKSREQLKETVTFKVDKGIAKGFRVGLKGNDVYYDFTDESIAELLAEFLNPTIREILNKA